MLYGFQGGCTLAELHCFTGDNCRGVLAEGLEDVAACRPRRSKLGLKVMANYGEVVLQRISLRHSLKPITPLI
jgi:hypothetical protein